MPTTVIDTLITEFVFKGDRRELDRLEQGVKNLNKRINDVVRPFAVAGTVGAAALGLIGKAGLNTEEALLRTRAALGLTEDQMRTLREEALRVGSRLPLNTADIVNAQQAYGKLGATFQEIIRDTPAIAGAAVATGLAPEQVARYARIIQNVFGGDVAGNLDVMLKAANNSAGAFMDFGESLQFSGQSAADAGLDFQTYIATLGGIAGAGREVQSISPGLAAMWARLAKAEEDIGEGGQTVTDAFQGVGISMEDVNAAMDGTADGFVRLLELINKANLTSSQLTALLSTLAGDTYSASISYAVQNPEAIRELLDHLEQAGGEVERQQEIIISGASGGIKEMMAQIDTLLNRLAEFGTLAGIQSFTNAVSALIGWLTKTNEEGELVNRRWLQMISIGVTALASLLAVAAALKITTFALSGFVVLVKLARGAVWLWRNALILTRIQMGLLSVQTWWANSALRAFMIGLKASRIGMLLTGGAARAMWLAITGPVGLVIAAFALVGFVVYKFRRQILGALKAVWNWIKGNWPLLVGILLGPFGIVGALVWKFRDDIVGAIMWIKDKIMAIFTSLRDFVIGIWQGLGAAIGGAFRGVINAVISGLNKALDAAASFVEAIKGALDKVPFGNPLGDFLLGVASKLRAGIPNFAIGGIVPGPLGRPLLATVHGGEMVLPVGVSNVLAQMLEGFRLGPAALPQAPYHYGQMYRSSVTNRTVNINITEPIVIQTQATDAKGIAQEIGEAIQDQIRNIAYDHDGPVER